MKICVQNDFLIRIIFFTILNMPRQRFHQFFLILNKSKNPRKSEGHIQTNY